MTVEERDGVLEVMIEVLTGKEQEGWAWRVAEQNSIDIIQNFAVKIIWGFWVGFRVSNNQLDGSIVGWRSEKIRGWKIFSFLRMYLVGEMEKWEGEKLFYLVEKESGG